MQLTIDFAIDKDASFHNYYSFGNEALVHQLKHFVVSENTVPSQSLVYIHGLGGNGKSHLLQALCQFSHDEGINNQYIPLNVFSHFDIEATLGMESFGLLVIDDIDCLKHNPAWQQALFDLINRVLEQNGKIIFAGNKPPEKLLFTLPDLVSRLQWGQIWALASLNDNEQIEMMMFRAKCKGMVLTPDVAHFIHLRLSRDAKTIIRCLEKLDKATLTEQRRLTIPFVKSVMRW